MTRVPPAFLRAHAFRRGGCPRAGRRGRGTPAADKGSMIPALLQSCGTWGNNILCENVGYKHLINISKIALPLDVKVPDAAELFKD